MESDFVLADTRRKYEVSEGLRVDRLHWHRVIHFLARFWFTNESILCTQALDMLLSKLAADELTLSADELSE